jgi:hypothetical protein
MNTKPLFRLIYRSLPTTLPSLVLLDIVRAAEHRNASLGASGILAYGPSAYAQVIEGSEEAVTGLAALIASDARHRMLWSDLRPIARRVIAPSLPMGYSALHELREPLTGTDRNTEAVRAQVGHVLFAAAADKYPSAVMELGLL